MHFLTAFATVAVVPLISAHAGPGIPKIAGLDMRDLKARSLMDNLRTRAAEIIQDRHHLKPRQGGTDGQCGASFGSCAEGYCCSDSGWCGSGGDYCYSPGCNYQYGPACPENKTPSGADTSSVTRTKLGNVEYGGAGIYQCTTPGTVALTFDDGPFKDYTDHVLDLFAQYNAKGTFFITGNNINKGAIDTDAGHTATIKRMYNAGHQVASHTWTHLDLSKVSAADRKAQMVKNEMAIRNILGVFPTYMRPPYSSCTAESGCWQAMADLGYHVIYFDVDTDDYNQLEPSQIQNSKNWFRGNITAGGATYEESDWLSIAHDIHPQTAYNLTEYMLSTITQLKYKAVTVGECLGDPSPNWYRSGSGGGSPSSTKTSTAPSSTATRRASTDGSCGGTNGYTCSGSAFGNCCSQYGWCGSTSDHCGTGCQSGLGSCGSNTAPPAPTPTLKTSTDGSCAGSPGFTCKGSAFGNCCSQYGWCGNTVDHCGSQCQKAFGTCN